MKAVHWACRCGDVGHSEASAGRHAAVCGLLGLPRPTTCKVTLLEGGEGSHRPTCGEPSGADGLCVRHQAERRRLS